MVATSTSKIHVYCNAVVQNCSKDTPGSFRHIFASDRSQMQTYKRTLHNIECRSILVLTCRHIIGAMLTCKLLLQTGEDYTVLQLCNTVQLTFKYIPYLLKAMYKSPNLQQVELFHMFGCGIATPMVYCLCLKMECSLSTGKHNAKKGQQTVIQQRPVPSTWGLGRSSHETFCCPSPQLKVVTWLKLTFYALVAILNLCNNTEHP